MAAAAYVVPVCPRPLSCSSLLARDAAPAARLCLNAPESRRAHADLQEHIRAARTVFLNGGSSFGEAPSWAVAETRPYRPVATQAASRQAGASTMERTRPSRSSPDLSSGSARILPTSPVREAPVLLTAQELQAALDEAAARLLNMPTETPAERAPESPPRQRPIMPSQPPGQAKPRFYWSNFENLRREIVTFMSTHSLEAVPTQVQLMRHGRGDIYYAIRKHGGFSSVARRLGLPTSVSEYWSDFENVEKELRIFMAQQSLKKLPTKPQLLEAGRKDLVLAIQKHGGTMEVSKRMGFTSEVRERGYWKKMVHVAEEVKKFVQEHQLPHMPHKHELEAAGRHDLVGAILRQGGLAAVAEAAQLEVKKAALRRPPSYWDDISNLERELLQFIEEHGTPGRMPTSDELKRNGASHLRYAIVRHGGAKTVARMLHLRRAHARQDDSEDIE